MFCSLKVHQINRLINYITLLLYSLRCLIGRVATLAGLFPLGLLLQHFWLLFVNVDLQASASIMRDLTVLLLMRLKADSPLCWHKDHTGRCLPEIRCRNPVLNLATVEKTFLNSRNLKTLLFMSRETDSGSGRQCVYVNLTVFTFEAS